MSERSPDSVVLDGVASVLLSVDGIHAEAVYSAGGGTAPGVADLPADIGDGPMPAAVVLSGPKSIIAGSFERTTWTIEVSVWMPAEHPIGTAYRTLLDLEEPIREAFRAHSRGNAGDPAVQSVVVTRVERIDRRQWVPDSRAWYLVLPFELEAKVDRAVRYRPV